MEIALVNGIRTLASKGQKGICPFCNEEVISKCGDLRIDHWAHKVNTECYGSQETEWHRTWKSFYPESEREIIFNKDGNKHRADIYHYGKYDDGIWRTTVIEFQNSSITAEEILEREYFYENMIWVLNGESIGSGIELYSKKGYFTIRWKYMNLNWLKSSMPIWVDLGTENTFLKIKKLYDNRRGWGIGFDHPFNKKKI